MKISPSIGRVVWFWRDAPIRPKDAQPEAAIVTYVHNDNLVNLVVFDKNGVPCSNTSVVLRQPGEDVPHVPHCEWMPYQVGQAKAHAAEDAAATANVGNALNAQTERVVSPTPTPVPPEPIPDPPGKQRAR